MQLNRNTGDGTYTCMALLFAGMLVFLSVFLAAPAFAQQDLNCDDFDSQAEAQAELENDSEDPNDLDPDDDGQACEDFDYEGGTGGGNNDGDNTGGNNRNEGDDNGGSNRQVCEQVVELLIDQDLNVSGDVNNVISGDDSEGGSIAEIIADLLDISVDQVQECIQESDEDVIDDPGGTLPFTGGSTPTFLKGVLADGLAFLALAALCTSLAGLGIWMKDRRGW